MMQRNSRWAALARLAGASVLSLAAHHALALEPGGGEPVSETAAEARADALIAQMTPAEKAAQLSDYFYLQPMPAMNKQALQALEGDGAGAMQGISDPAEINRLQRIALERSRLKIPMLFGFDVVHGMRTIFPVPIGMAASWDPRLVEQAQSVAAQEARAAGVTWTFGPMVDIARDPRWGRIVEGAGEDPFLGSVMAAAQVRGFQGDYLGAPNHILAGPKHFAGYGAALGGRDYDEANISDSELWNVYLPPFKAAIDAGAGNIMSAYMALNGVPATGNAWLLTDVLRKAWDFKGFVVTDDGAVNALVTHGLAADRQDAAARAVNAGVDMEMIPPTQGSTLALLPAAIQGGSVAPATLDDAVRRVLETKIRLGLFEHPFVDETRAEAVLNDPAHLRLARAAAERSAVLLKNDGGILPLDRKSLKAVAIIGPLADAPRDILGPWVFPQNKPPSTTILAGLKAALGPKVRVDYSEGVRMPPRTFPSPFAMMEHPTAKPPLDETAAIQHAVDMAKAADVAILVLGEAQEMIGESASTSSLDLPGRQQELLDAVTATGKPVIVLLMNGRPLDLKDTRAQAILDLWYPGSAGGDAAADLLLGAANPGGKLPFTWIRSAAQAPNPYAQLISHSPHGADSRYWNGTSAPIYPFGYGLSYTTFAYSNLHVDRPAYGIGESVQVSVDLKNTGSRTGDEVAQVYIHQRWGSATRPVRELKGFQRVSLRPGEQRTLHFTLKPEDLRYWSAATRSWVQEASVFDLWVGGDSKAPLGSTFQVKARP